MVYSSYISEDITEKQKRKFFSSVYGPKEIFTEHLTMFQKLSLKSIEAPNLYEFPITGKVPNLKGHGSRKNPGYEAITDVRRLDFVEPHILSNRDRYLKSGFHHAGEVTHLHVEDFLNPLPMGRIGFIQEPGYKLRAVANPHRGLQYLLHPLKVSLLLKLKSAINDCTFDQEKGVRWAQDFIRSHRPQGVSLSSVDLSDATNLFPLSLQLELLRNSYSDQPWMLSLVDLFEQASKKKWVSAYGEDNLTIRWTKGQPLGLGPSFPSFALGHHLVMYHVIQRCGDLSPAESFSFDRFLAREHKYKILGDDIIMSSKYESTYKSLMTELGCSVSEDKTITSDILGEFASRVITQDAIYVQNKWKNPSDYSFLALAKNLGPEAFNMLKPRQRKVVKAVAMLPEECGGLGWNPKGIPLSIRKAAAPFILSKMEETVVHRKDIQATSLMMKHARDIDQGLIIRNEDWTLRVENDLTLKVDSPSRTIKDFLRISFRFISERVFKNEVPDGYSLMDVTTDPRGTPTLDSYENRLGVPDELRFLGLSDEEVLEELVFLESNSDKVAEVIEDSGVLDYSLLDNPVKDTVVRTVERTFSGLGLR
jgi:hypothetical protein